MSNNGPPDEVCEPIEKQKSISTNEPASSDLIMSNCEETSAKEPASDDVLESTHGYKSHLAEGSVYNDDGAKSDKSKSSANEATSTELIGSADDAVEHFFEGLDEDAFIANLQVVSSWEGNSSPRTTSPSISIKKKGETIASEISNSEIQENSEITTGSTVEKQKISLVKNSKSVLSGEDKTKPKVRNRTFNEESALDRFKTFLGERVVPSASRKNEKMKRDNIDPNLKKRSKLNIENDPKINLGSRRDPDKTKRDIAKDKVNKSKETLIKKMETGLIPPGMEMDDGTNPSNDNAKSADSKKKSPNSIKDSPERKPSVRSVKRKSSEEMFHQQHLRKRSRSRKSPPSRSKYSPERYRFTRRSSSRKKSPGNIRYDYSPNRHRRIQQKLKDRERDNRVKQYKRDSSYERYSRPRYRSRPSSRESPKYRRKPEKKEDFLTYLSKQNINTSDFSNPAPITNYPAVSHELVQYPVLPPNEPFYKQPYAAPSFAPENIEFTMVPPPIIGESIISQDNMQIVPNTETYFTAPPPIIYNPSIPSDANHQSYNYDNGFVSQNIFTDPGHSINPISAFPDSNMVYNSNNMMTDSTTAPMITENPYYSYEEKDKIIKQCDNVVKKLNELDVPMQIMFESKEDKQQRDIQFTGTGTSEEYCSPLNRNVSIDYNFTKNGDKNMLLVPTVLSTLKDTAILSTSAPEMNGKRDSSSQTSDMYCCRCELNDMFQKENKHTGTFLLFNKSVHSQVDENDLISSKLIFTPNQNASTEAQQPVSMTHMTPAQILVAELTAKTINMQRNAIQQFRFLEDKSKKHSKNDDSFSCNDNNEANNYINSNYGSGNSSADKCKNRRNRKMYPGNANE